MGWKLMRSRRRWCVCWFSSGSVYCDRLCATLLIGHAREASQAIDDATETKVKKGADVTATRYPALHSTIPIRI